MADGIEGQIAAGAAAALGVLARAKLWRRPDGKMDWWVAGTELATAPACGLIAYGLGSYWGLNSAVMTAVAGLFGLLGTAVLTEIGKAVLERFVNKGGGP